MVDELLTALNGTDIPFVEFAWAKAPACPYGVVAIDNSPDSVWADGHMVDQIIEGTVDLFCKGVGRTEADTIQGVLNNMDGLSWEFSNVQYEDAARITHYEWVFRYVGGFADGQDGD